MAPENTKKLPKKYENGPKITIFVFFSVILSYFWGAPWILGFCIFSYFRDSGVLGSVRPLQDRNACCVLRQNQTPSGLSCSDFRTASAPSASTLRKACAVISLVASFCSFQTPSRCVNSSWKVRDLWQNPHFKATPKCSQSQSPEFPQIAAEYGPDLGPPHPSSRASQWKNFVSWLVKLVEDFLWIFFRPLKKN